MYFPVQFSVRLTLKNIWGTTFASGGAKKSTRILKERNIFLGTQNFRGGKIFCGGLRGGGGGGGGTQVRFATGVRTANCFQFGKTKGLVPNL